MACLVRPRTLPRRLPRPSLRFRSVYLPDQSQIYALPFRIPSTLALERLKLFAIAPVLTFSNALNGLGEAFFGPAYFKSSVELLDWKAVYVPGWSVQADVSFKALHAFEETLRSVEPDSAFGTLDDDQLGSMVKVQVGSMFFPGEFCTFSLSVLG